MVACSRSLAVNMCMALLLPACVSRASGQKLSAAPIVNKATIACEEEDTTRLEAANADATGLSLTLKCLGRRRAPNKTIQVELSLRNRSASRAYVVLAGFYEGYNFDLDIRLPSGRIVRSLCINDYRRIPTAEPLYPGDSISRTVVVTMDCYPPVSGASKRAALVARYTGSRPALGYDLTSNVVTIELTGGDAPDDRNFSSNQR